jgi:hypothetical protein
MARFGPVLTRIFEGWAALVSMQTRVSTRIFLRIFPSFWTPTSRSTSSLDIRHHWTPTITPSPPTPFWTPTTLIRCRCALEHPPLV